MAIPQPISKTCVMLERGIDAPVQARDEVRHRHVQQAGGGHAQREGQQSHRGFQREVTHHAADHGGEAGQQVERQRPAARNARMQQHGEVADFLGNLVRHDGHRGDQPQVHVGEKGGGDQHAVEHVVQGIAHQHQ